jgi:hypothetical protein
VIPPGKGCSPLCFLAGLPRSKGGTATEVRTDDEGSAESDERHKVSTAPDGAGVGGLAENPSFERPSEKGRGDAPIVDSAGIRRSEWAERSSSLATRRATPEVRPRLFGRVLPGSRPEQSRSRPFGDAPSIWDLLRWFHWAKDEGGEFRPYR